MAWRVGPKIDLTSVVLNLDAANPASYNGVGSTWYDLSGNGNHFTLQGTSLPVWSGKTISFNTGTDAGKNQYAVATNNNVGDFGSNDFTIEYVATFPNNYVGLYSGVGGPVMSNNHGVYHNQGSDGVAGFSLGIIDQTRFQDNGAIPLSSNDPCHFGGASFLNNRPDTGSSLVNYMVYTIKRNGAQMTGSMYKNTSNVGANRTGDVPPLPLNSRIIQYTFVGDGNISNINNPLSIMRAYTLGAYGSGSIYTIKMYNRVLNQSEINQNYQIYRQYYGF